MKKQILNIGKVLSKKHQREIQGGGRPCQTLCPSVLNPGDFCRTADCQFGQCNASGICELYI